MKKYHIFLTIFFCIYSATCQASGSYYYINNRSNSPVPGGLIADTAHVAQSDSIYIGPKVIITDHVSISGNVHISGNVIVSGHVVIDGENIRIDGSDGAIRISGHVEMTDYAQVSGHSVLSGTFHLGGTAVVSGYANINAGEMATGIYSPLNPDDINAMQFDILSKADHDRNLYNEHNASRDAMLDYALNVDSNNTTADFVNAVYQHRNPWYDFTRNIVSIYSSYHHRYLSPYVYGFKPCTIPYRHYSDSPSYPDYKKSNIKVNVKIKVETNDN
ncbi:MAG: hypothetical protein KAU22_05440 [Desulfuromonadales bacterium]|nr:hypothetical protein [Desulfuromonadales bacterium]